ncbi:MAG: DUF5658 family protein [Pseudomonadota bacterium]
MSDAIGIRLTGSAGAAFDGQVPERRGETERRTFSWRTVAYGFLRSRRRSARRGGDAELVFVDWHHPWLFFLAVGTMLLSCADAFLTLQLLSKGMIEANPFMAAVMEYGTGAFVTTKMALTGGGILVLVFLAKTRFMNRVRTGLILTSFFSFYCCLVCYEIVSLLKVL